MAALSSVSDLARGHPTDEAQRACLVALALARGCGIDGPALQDVSRGPTEPEVELLRLLAAGRSQAPDRGRARAAAIHRDTHTVHISAKRGVSTRAALALFAMEHDLLRA